MATKVYNTTFKLRRANAAQWPDDYVLQEGEPGFEIDTGKLKIGDGVTTWENLSYITDLTIFTENGIPIQTTTDVINGAKNATNNTVLTKQNGILTWAPTQQLTTVEELVQLLEDSGSLNDIVYNVVNNQLEDKNLIKFKGKAIAADTDENDKITFYILNEFGDLVEASKIPGDVYIYQEYPYVYDNSENVLNWIQLGDSQKYNSTQDFVTLDEFFDLQKTINQSLAPATTGILGLVKGSNASNQISVGQDGIMTVNSLNIDKLVQTDELVIDCNGYNNNNNEEEEP